MTDMALCKVCGRVTQLQLLSNKSTSDNEIDCSWSWCSFCGSAFKVTILDPTDSKFHHMRREWGDKARIRPYLDEKEQLYDFLIDQMDHHNFPKGKLLDVESSWGGLVLKAREKGYNPIAMDINPDCINYLNKLSIPGYCISSLKSLLGKVDNLQIILMIDVIYYFDNFFMELKYAFELLEPGGWIVIRNPNKIALLHLSELIGKVSRKISKKIFNRTVYDHNFVLNTAYFRKMLGEVNFRLIREQPDPSRTYMSYKKYGIKWKRDIFPMLVYKGALDIYRLTGKNYSPGVILWLQKQ